MKIGIIGAGNIGATLARKLAAAGHEVKLANTKGAESLRSLAQELGVTAAESAEAVKDAEVIIVSIPTINLPQLGGLFADAPGDVTIIDTSNYYPFRDGAIAELADRQSESTWSSEQLGRPVIKAFNAVLAHTLAERGKPHGAADRLAIPVAGDDARGKRIAMELVDQVGFEPYDAGSLADSWRQQPGTPAYCTELTVDELKPALAAADKARAPELRDMIINEIFAVGGNVTHEQIISRNREATAPK